MSDAMRHDWLQQ